MKYFEIVKKENKFSNKQYGNSKRMDAMFSVFEPQYDYDRLDDNCHIVAHFHYESEDYEYKADLRVGNYEFEDWAIHFNFSFDNHVFDLRVPIDDITGQVAYNEADLSCWDTINDEYPNVEEKTIKIEVVNKKLTLDFDF